MLPYRVFFSGLVLACVLAGCDAQPSPCPLPADAPAAAAAYVIHISVDGLRSDAVTRQSASLPAFARLRAEGAYTDNARSDADYRITLPNHTDQLTGRPVVGRMGHNWTVNVDPEPGVTLHSNKGSYVASVFDVAHDAGLRTAAYVSKSKFSLYRTSYDADHGAPDTTGADDGRAKIDVFVFDDDTEALADRLVRDERAEPFQYTFLHLRDPDAAGHATGWDVTPGSPYMQAVERADTLVGRVLDLVQRDPRLRGRTTVIVTADHGGRGTSHGAEIPEDYTIPFAVWGPGVPAADLYALNANTRQDPGTANVGWGASRQPVRNGDAANLALRLLGLRPVPGSTIGVCAPLHVVASAAPRGARPGAEPTP